MLGADGYMTACGSVFDPFGTILAKGSRHTLPNLSTEEGQLDVFPKA